MGSELETRQSEPVGVLGALRRLHADESGIAMTEYIMVFTFVTFGATIALIGVGAYIKAYRDFMMWWLAHPAI
jgi:Flp pilus assembly pilin Flp